MSGFAMTRDAADDVFSIYIRARDTKCARCRKPGLPNKQGLPVLTLDNSHFWGRGRENTRFDEENCDALCSFGFGGCHRYWEKEDREAYRAFKVKQLGQARFDALMLRANTYKKKDRKMELIRAKALLKTVQP